MNRVWAPDGKNLDLTDNEVKQYLSFEMISAPNVFRTYGQDSLLEYQ